LLLTRRDVERAVRAVHEVGAAERAAQRGRPEDLAHDYRDRRQREHRVLDWADRHGAVPMPFASVRIGGITVDPFLNANTPEDLETLSALLAKAAI
jgi:molybdopterin-guanine dinucleotide biosynthesis protein A